MFQILLLLSSAVMFSAPALAADPAPCPSLPTGTYTNSTYIDYNFAALPAGSLKNTNFNGANLSGAVFNGQDLSGSTFSGAILGPSAKGNTSFTNSKLSKTCFAGAVMNGTDFNYAQFDCTNFDDTSLMQANFGPAQSFSLASACRSSFIRATLDVKAISTSNWGMTDFSFSNFQNLSPSTFSLQNTDITNAILVGVQFQGLNMQGANLTQVNFTEAALTGANMTNAAMNGANLQSASADLAVFTCARFYYGAGSGSDFNSTRCAATPNTTAPAVAANLQRTNLANSVMNNVTLDFALLNWANLSGVNFNNASFNNASLAPTSNLNAATIAGTSFTGAQLQQAALNSVTFSNSNLTNANFYGANLASTSFAGAIMSGANFQNATLESVGFQGAILQHANFYGTTVKTVPNGGGSGGDFSCAQLGGANFTNASVTQASFANAVMPGPSNCCAAVAGFQNCGTIAATGQAYGPVSYPPLTTPVTCPNGQNALCSGAQWQLSPNWTTTYCSTNGNSQTLWVPPDCSTSPGRTVTFADPNLQACILATMPGATSINVATAEAQVEVICPGKGIKDLGGLENFTNLQVLDLTANQIATFNLQFKNLRQLKLGSNRLTTLSLSGMPNVVWLDASSNQLAGANGLSGLSAVYFQTLDVSNNALSALDLSTQTRLQTANLANNQISSITDTFNPNLNNLKSLSFLNLSYNQLTGFGSLAPVSYSAKNNSKGTLRTLLLSCNAQYACNTLGLDSSYPAYQTSQCATFNIATNAWVPNANPVCPN